MAPTTSTKFASAIASGTDWRDTSKAVLEELEKTKTAADSFNFGFLYVSDYLADDLNSILNLFKSVLNVENWVGSVGIGVCGNGTEYIDTPAISAMIGSVDPQDFIIFPALPSHSDDAEKILEPWLDHHDPMLVLVHGDPMIETNPAHVLSQIDALTGGYVVGGLTSGRTHHYQICNTLSQNGYSGAVFSQNIKVASVLSQGCRLISEPHTVTGCDDHMILELNEKPALEVFENDIRIMTIKKTDIDPDRVMIDPLDAGQENGLPEEIQSVFRGEILAALPVSESDQGDYLVRNIIGVDDETQSVHITHNPSKGERVMFVYRDNESVRNDLSRSLLELRQRVSRDEGSFAPKGGIYISCVARAFSDFSLEDENESADKKNAMHCGEMALVRDIIGDVPLCGFYAAGEINSGRLYGYSGILILFL